MIWKWCRQDVAPLTFIPWRGATLRGAVSIQRRTPSQEATGKQYLMTGPGHGRHCVCLTNFIWHSTSDLKCHVMFSKWKWMSIDIYIFLLNVTRLIVRVISISKVSLDVCFFVHKSHSMQNLNCAYQMTCSLFLCKFCHVKCQKLAKTLSKIHWWQALDRFWTITFHCLSWLRFECRRKAHCDLHAIKILNSDIEEG